MNLVKLLVIVGSGLVLLAAYMGLILKDMIQAQPYWLIGGSLLAIVWLTKELDIKI